MVEKKRKYEMEECNECEVEGKNATNGYSSGGLCIFWVDMNIDRTCSSYIVQSIRSNVRSIDLYHAQVSFIIIEENLGVKVRRKKRQKKKEKFIVEYEVNCA